MIDIIKMDKSENNEKKESNEKKNELLNILKQNDLSKSNSENLITLINKDGENIMDSKVISIDEKRNNTFVVDLSNKKKIKEE